MPAFSLLYRSLLTFGLLFGFTTFAVGAPNDKAREAASCTAFTTAACVWPATICRHETGCAPAAAATASRTTFGGSTG